MVARGAPMKPKRSSTSTIWGSRGENENCAPVYTGTQFSKFWRVWFRTFSASFSKPVPQTTQDTPKYEKLTKTTPRRVSEYVPVLSWNRPLGCLDSDGGFKIAFSCVRVPSKLQNSTKMKPKRSKRLPILCNEHQKRHCSHDPVDTSANTFACATAWILPASQYSKAFFLGRRVTRSGLNILI